MKPNRLPVVSGRHATRVLELLGFAQQKRRGKGSHIVMVRREPTTIITVPDHRELDRGTLRAIIRHAGLSVGAFLDLLNR
jgi:predicted RNA binding protein YcfA (HicA-like mRNA interferase family)